MHTANIGRSEPLSLGRYFPKLRKKNLWFADAGKLCKKTKNLFIAKALLYIALAMSVVIAGIAGTEVADSWGTYGCNCAI
jgi:hypothetical protein